MIERSDFQAIQERNRRVEAEKAWETSLTRRGMIAVVTYFVAGFFLWLVQIPSPWLSALVPTGGYILSTLSLRWAKKLWLKRLYKL